MPIVADFDGSVLPLAGEQRIDLRAEEESIRFACRTRVLRALAPRFAELPDEPAFLGSGDFHHVTLLLLQRLRVERLQVVVFDNHPDNMLFPFGIHCGSWVAHAARLPFVERVHVVGITSGDVESLHVLENHSGLLRRNRVAYWCVGRNLRVLQRLGAGASARSFPTCADAIDALLRELAPGGAPLYLSIDKDVLAPEVVQTNWDQGVMQLAELEGAIAPLQPRVVGADVVGDVSSYRYRARWKRMLSVIDAQPAIAPESLRESQEAQRRVNERLAALLQPRRG